jgi:hypothetical protein
MSSADGLLLLCSLQGTLVQCKTIYNKPTAGMQRQLWMPHQEEWAESRACFVHFVQKKHVLVPRVRIVPECAPTSRLLHALQPLHWSCVMKGRYVCCQCAASSRPARLVVCRRLLLLYGMRWFG